MLPTVVRPDGVWLCGSTGRGRSFKDIIWSQKREKSVSFVCGQRYSWTTVLRIRLLVRAYALVFRNQTQPMQSKKKGRGIPIRNHLLASCTVALDSINMAACAQPCLRRGIHVRPCSLRLCAYLPCGLQVQPLDYFTDSAAGHTRKGCGKLR